ncbi:MAG: PilZ domain-containing protein [Candidatus Omnitrophota bacterium]|jgi:c-di-GMP-binding flagellar brake protein YcgR
MILIVELLFVVLLSMILYMIYLHERVLTKNNTPHAMMEEYWSGKERREHFRFEKSLNVSYAVEKKQHLKNSGKTVDISEGGMKLLLDEKLPISTIVDLKVTLPNSRKFAEVEGEVIWSEEVKEIDPSGKRLFHSGIRFLAVKEPSNGKLAEYVRSLASDLGKA